MKGRQKFDIQERTFEFAVRVVKLAKSRMHVRVSTARRGAESLFIVNCLIVY